MMAITEHYLVKTHGCIGIQPFYYCNYNTAQTGLLLHQYCSLKSFGALGALNRLIRAMIMKNLYQLVDSLNQIEQLL